MCCSGHQKDNKETNLEDVQKKRSRRSFHIPMMLCCIVPIIVLFFLGPNAISDSIKNIFVYLMIAFCLASHLFMKDHSHPKNKDNCMIDEQKP